MPEILMPRLSDTMEEGTLSRWLKHEGEQIHRGDVIAEIETDKATMELEAYDEGPLTRLLVAEGSTVSIGTPVAVVGEESASAREEGAAPPAVDTETERSAPAQATGPAEPPEPAAPAPTGEPPAQAASVPSPGRESTQATQRVPTSPLARRIAAEHGIDIATITGSGPGGRIVRADIDAAITRRGRQTAPAPGTQPAPVAPHEQPSVQPVAEDTEETPLRPARRLTPQKFVRGAQLASHLAGEQGIDTSAGDDAEEVPLSRVRRLTAERLAQSAQQAPHFYLTCTVDAEPLLAFRAEINARLGGQSPRVSVNDLIVKACATALRTHPELNASWDDTRILRHHRIHIGIAVALDDGLNVPVLHDADRKTLTDITREAHTLADKARSGRLTLDELTGGTFTISNLGPYGIDHFTAVINPPQAAILAVGAAHPQPVVRDGELAPGTVMALTLSIDHRVLDGATGAAFLAGLKELLEQPLRIVV
ncbi:dihydrolipoamide acetyltransferase family protein [Streptomyces mexicanus]|uniref:dihydrolipoamide acetyltransferase family protein n=1 Tax=Streptomyces mexicanus TaxID=178566 RepID=UPI0031EEF035